jgi:Protein of unknown function (DUF1264)
VSSTVGPAQLMMAFTKDGQLDHEMAKKREEAEGINMSTKQQERSDFPDYTPRQGADYWQSGQAMQATMQTVDTKMK